MDKGDTFADRRLARLQDRIEQIEIELDQRAKSAIERKDPRAALTFTLPAIALVVFFFISLFVDSSSGVLIAASVGLLAIPAFTVLLAQQEDQKSYRLREELRERTRELEKLEKSAREPVDLFVEINLSNLEEYYALVSKHTSRSFLVALWSGMVGFALLLIGLVIPFQLATKTGDPDRATGYITAGAGVLIQFISTIFFVLYRRTVAELKTYHERLLRVQNTLIAFRYVKTIEDAAEQGRMLGLMISTLLTRESVGEAEGDRKRGSTSRRSSRARST